MTTRKIILLELNEVPYRIFDAYCERVPGSFLARALPRCRQYVTTAEDARQLDPWISWATLHRGVNDDSHAVLHLGQQLDVPDRDFPPIWRLLAAADCSVGVFGSLHSSHTPPDIDRYAFYLPDCFAEEAVAHPSQLAAFQRFNLAMTRRSARNVDRGVPVGPTLDFLKTAPRLGIRPRTCAAVAGQLADELRHPYRKVRRRSFQPVIMFDIFERLLRSTQPEFATFYSNHVAAAMHRYWAALFPGDYETAPDPDFVERFRDEIVVAMGHFSRLFQRLVRFANGHPEYVVVVASSMGQGAIENEPTFEFVTIQDLPRFMQRMGVPDGAWTARSAMVPCLSVVVDEPCREPFRRRLRQLTVAGRAMVEDVRPVHELSFDEGDGGFFHLFLDIDNFAGEPIATVGDERLTFAELGIGSVPHEDGVRCTAQHTRDGSLFVYDPADRSRKDGGRERVSAFDFVPSVLANFGVPLPPYLRGHPSLRFA